MTIKIVVPISGGKDSQACWKLALQKYDPSEVIGLFCDTQFEHPITYQHIENLKTIYGKAEIIRLTAGSVIDQCRKHKRFPVGGARFCTEELKMWVTKRYLKELTNTVKTGIEVWYGMRSEESPQRQKRYEGMVCNELYTPNEVLVKYPKYLAKRGVMFRLAILDWTEKEVFDFLDGQHNPLYDEGFDRVGCFPCLASGDKNKEKSFQYDDFGRTQFEKVKDLSIELGKSVWTSKGGEKRNGICSLMCGE